MGQTPEDQGGSCRSEKIDGKPGGDRPIDATDRRPEHTQEQALVPQPHYPEHARTNSSSRDGVGTRSALLISQRLAEDNAGTPRRFSC
jgi:hypothetical protein